MYKNDYLAEKLLKIDLMILDVFKKSPVCQIVQSMHPQRQNKAISVWVLQQSSFRADNQVKKYTTTLKGLGKGEMRPGETAEWADEIKNIPPVPPSRLGAGCKNIDVKYVLTVSSNSLFQVL